MEKRQFGSTGLQVSVLGFGGAEIGMEGASEGDVQRLLNAALDAGLNVIDTAECYGTSEELIGKTVSHRRGDYHLFTKVGHPHGMESATNLTPDSILESIQRSLRLLKTDLLEIVHLHSCSEAVLKKGDAITALQTARERGYTRFIGYSGDGTAARYAIETGAFDSLQTSVSVADQEAIDLTIPRAREKEMGIIAKRPIANAAWKTGHKPENSYAHEYWERLRKLDFEFLETAEAAKSFSTALRFTLTVPGVHVAIVGTKKPERWQENARLLEAGPLPAADFDAIRERWEDVAPKTWVGQV